MCIIISSSVVVSVETNVREFLKQKLGNDLFLHNTTTILRTHFETNVRESCDFT